MAGEFSLDRKPGLRAIRKIGRLVSTAGDATGVADGIRPSLLRSASLDGILNSKCPAESVRVANRLSVEQTSARPTGSWVTLLRTVPRMVLPSVSGVALLFADKGPASPPQQRRTTHNESALSGRRAGIYFEPQGNYSNTPEPLRNGKPYLEVTAALGREWPSPRPASAGHLSRAGGRGEGGEGRCLNPRLAPWATLSRSFRAELRS